MALCTLLLSVALCTACLSGSEASAPDPALKPQTPLLAYLAEGQLSVIPSTGGQSRVVATAPDGEAINQFLWTPDGGGLHYVIGQRFHRVTLSEGRSEMVGEIAVPPGTSIDRLEPSRDAQEVIIHALDADATSKIYVYKPASRETRELSIDQYSAIAPPQSLSVRQFSDLSVSPDSERLLFKEAAGLNEQLFVGDLETGARLPLLDLMTIEGFEDSAQADGGRHLLEATWSPDGRYVLFLPAQSCSEAGLCYGRLFLIDVWGDRLQQLTGEMMVMLAAEWDPAGRQLVYEDGGQLKIAQLDGTIRTLAEGLHPKWQPHS
jgi:Tol biopolymer transport system component